MSTEIKAWIASERQASSSAAEAAIRIEIEHVMALTPVLPMSPKLVVTDGEIPSGYYDAQRMIVARRQQIETLLQLAMDAGPEVRAKFAKEFN